MRRLFLIVSAIVLLSSCAYHSPFTDEPLFSSMGGDGDIVVTLDMERAKEGCLSASIPSSPVTDRAERLSLSIGTESYGAVEGDFGYALVNAYFDWSSGWKKAAGDERYYVNRSLGMEAAVPESGVLLFSMGDYRHALSRLIEERPLVIPPSTSSLMSSALGAVYTRNAYAVVPMGLGITDEVADNIDEIIILLDEGEDGLIVSGWIDMDSPSSAKALLTVLRNELLRSIRERGERPDFSVLSSYYSQNGDKVVLSGIEIDTESVEAIVSRYMSSDAAGAVRGMR